MLPDDLCCAMLTPVEVTGGPDLKGAEHYTLEFGRSVLDSYTVAGPDELERLSDLEPPSDDESMFPEPPSDIWDLAEL
eukprot:5046523-Alexandrium_andersonii.AAC.1